MLANMRERAVDIFSLARLRPVVPVIVCLAISLFLVNACLLRLMGAAPRAFALGEAYLDWKYFERAGDIIGALQQIYRSNARVSGKPLILYTGMSTAIEGIDPHILGAQSGCNASVAGICATGASMFQMFELLTPLLDSGMRPSVLIICLHPSWLAAEFSELPPRTLNPIPALQRGNWRVAAQSISWWNWLSENRYYMNQVVFRALYTARIRLGTVGDADPWSAPQRIGFSSENTEYQNAVTLAHFQDYGWFDPRHYTHEQYAQAEFLRAIISRFRDRGTDVRIVVMPEGSGFRSHVPREATDFLLAYLSREFQTRPVPVLDFAAVIPDSDFFDQIHMNDAGRAAFTQQLAHALGTCPR